MLVHEERLILQYLRQHTFCPFRQMLKACLPGTPPAWCERILQNLEWLGYVTVFPGADGQPEAVQLTSRGKDLRLV